MSENIKKPPMIALWDSESRLSNLFIIENDVLQEYAAPTLLEQELVRIFAEHREMLKILQSIPEKFLTND